MLESQNSFLKGAKKMDALKAVPEETTLMLENERVRVFSVKFKPGQKTLMHSHPDHVYMCLKMVS